MAVVLACVAVAGAALLAQEGAKPAHVMVMPADLTWGDPPPVFEKGMSFTVVSGDPGASGIFVVRLKMPAGYKIAPHWHPTDEHVTVLQGTLGLGMGDKFDKATAKELASGGYALLPAQMHHYAFAKTDTMVQVHGLGPFALTYINPADDPQKRTAAK
ncbi:MAG TPA: cupin domain-containing protein [Candidatus Polarisedimenticolia bacterium]|nr:cupin domain-containing protein [Candidatus Polarisedimenticolia bacterium]